MASTCFCLGLAAAVLLAAPAIAQESPGATKLPVDKGTEVGGVPVACTGVGGTKMDPQWQAYPVRVEFSDAKNDYLVGAHVVVSDAKGAEVLNVDCDAPWLLMTLPAGRYQVTADLLGETAKPRTASFTPPASGQKRVVLKFPDM
jgi:hypothetical protein